MFNAANTIQTRTQPTNSNSSLPRSPRVVRAAAQALCSLTLKNQANKTRCASLDAVATLLGLVEMWGVEDDGKRAKKA